MADKIYGFKILDTTNYHKDHAAAPVQRAGNGYASRDEAWEALLNAIREDESFPGDSAFFNALERASNRNPTTPTSIGYQHRGANNKIAIVMTESSPGPDVPGNAPTGEFGFRITDTAAGDAAGAEAPTRYRESGYETADQAREALTLALRDDPKFAENPAVRSALDDDERDTEAPTTVTYQDGDQSGELTIEIVKESRNKD